MFPQKEKQENQIYFTLINRKPESTTPSTATAPQSSENVQWSHSISTKHKLNFEPKVLASCKYVLLNAHHSIRTRIIWLDWIAFKGHMS